jgi:hypothetical protein
MNNQQKLKRVSKKLALTKETLRKLAALELSHVQGGIDVDVTGGCCDDTGSSKGDQIFD